MHGWTRLEPAGSGPAGGGPGGVSRGRAGPGPRVLEVRGPNGPGGGTMMPGETHSAAPGTAADLSRCQGCASLQQVRRLPEAGVADSTGRQGVGLGVLPPGQRPRALLAFLGVSAPFSLPTPLLLRFWERLPFLMLGTQDSRALLRRGVEGAGRERALEGPSFLPQPQGSPGLIRLVSDRRNAKGSRLLRGKVFDFSGSFLHVS